MAVKMYNGLNVWLIERNVAEKDAKKTVLKLIEGFQGPLSIREILNIYPQPIAERTLRRWLSKWVDDGTLIRSGNRRSTRYIAAHTHKSNSLRFLDGLSENYKTLALKQLRDLWTHSSTAIEGNTLSLGDTHFLLEEGLTISGKPLKDHQEVIGHARAIDLVYQCLAKPLTEEIIFELHQSIQTETITDIYKPNGAWKIETNGTYIVTRDNRQVFIEYAQPKFVPQLMDEITNEINILSDMPINLELAPEYYAKIHAGIAHVHPFWDGNGRIARLLANIPLLKSGLPPLVIPIEKRRTYIQLLAQYEMNVGQLTDQTGVWPDQTKLGDFVSFCKTAFTKTRDILASFRKELPLI